MFDQLDDALSELLLRELPVRNNEIDISFDAPRRDWSARLNRPTLNLFLYDLRENKQMRQLGNPWEVTRNDDGSITERRRARHVDMFYIISAWAMHSEDEHRLLGRTLMALFRNPILPDDLLPQIFQDESMRANIEVAQSNSLERPTELWGVMGNELRPVIVCQVGIAMNPYEPVTNLPLVRSIDLRSQLS